MDLIYQHRDPNDKPGSIWQSGYKQIPHDLAEVGINLVIYAASECPPLNHHLGAKLSYYPNDDMMCPPNTKFYDALLSNGQAAVPEVVKAVRDGKNVLVTCSQGVNRSSLVTGLAIRQLDPNTSAWDIINLIKDKRDGTLTNGTFQTMILTA
jgi:protein-tyrosine phosphatase